MIIPLAIQYMSIMNSQNEVKHPQAVDLGLPSGTKWASCNVGATNPEGYGLSEQSPYRISDAYALVFRYSGGGVGMDVIGHYKGLSIRPVTKLKE